MDKYIFIFLYLIAWFSHLIYILSFYTKLYKKNSAKKTDTEYEMLERKFEDKTNGKFGILYKQIEENEFEKFEKERMKILTLRCVYVFIISAILVLWIIACFDNKINNFLLLYPTLFLLAIPIIIASKTEDKFKDYQKNYKNKILEKIIKLYNDDFVYNQELPNNSIIKEAYKNIHSTGEISFGLIDDYIKLETEEYRIDCANICAITSYDNYNAKTVKETIDSFNGIFAYIVLNKSFNKEIRITTRGTGLNYIKFNLSQVTMDASQFENIFDVYAEDNISAYRALTHDIMLLLQEFYNECKIPFDIILKRNKMYIRLFTGPIFEPTALYSPVDKYEILEYYNILDLIFNLYKLVSKDISEESLS